MPEQIRAFDNGEIRCFLRKEHGEEIVQSKVELRNIIITTMVLRKWPSSGYSRSIVSSWKMQIVRSGGTFRTFQYFVSSQVIRVIRARVYRARSMKL